jgi:DNA repair protein RecO (recombination protein O)
MYYSLNAIILSRASFREDDLVVSVYSKERGKLMLVARGAKKIKSKLAGHLEPVSLSFLEIARGKSRDQLIGAQLIKSHAGIKNDILKTAYSNYFLELLNELTFENHADHRVFELTKKYLTFWTKRTTMIWLLAELQLFLSFWHSWASTRPTKRKLV